MASRDFSGRDIVKALTKNRFVIVDRTGSHVKLQYEHPTNDDDCSRYSLSLWRMNWVCGRLCERWVGIDSSVKSF